MGEQLAKWALKLEPENAAGHALLLATGISVRMLNGRERKELWRNNWVAPGLQSTWIVDNNEVHMFVVDNQDHPEMIEICAELVHDAGYVSYTEFVLHMIWKKKKRCCICVTIARSWLLHWGSSPQLTVLHSEYWTISWFVKIAIIPQSSIPR